MDEIQIKTALGWKAISEEDFRKKFYTPSMHAHARGLLHQQRFLLAGANEYRIGQSVRVEA